RIVESFWINVRPDLANLSAAHPASLAAAEELLADLDSTPELRATGTEARVANSKGTLTDLVIVLSGPSTIAGVVRILRLWLSRDRRRSITLTRKLEGQPAMEIRIEGEAISEQAVRHAIEQISQAAKSVGGGG